MGVSASRLAAQSLRVLPRKGLSRMVGRLADLELPKGVVRQAVRTFARIYDIDVSEADAPAGGYRSLDAFFTRRLRPGSRPLAGDDRVLVSPADGLLADAGPVDAGCTLRIKGRLYDVPELLGASDDAARFEGGTFAVIYLAPPDYHRVHAPATGPVALVRHIPGTLYPVNSIGTAHVPSVFARNERVAVVQRTEHFGDVATILVGAIGVGRIGLSFDDVVTNVGRAAGTRVYGDDAPRLERGQELGTFHLGSTVIVFVSKDAPVTLVRQNDERLRVGEALARRGAR